MSEQAIVKSQQLSAVTPWASRQDVRELGNRIKELLPGGQKMQPHEALALAQAAIAHNLDPFNGEIWFIPKQGLMAGIKGHRRAGHNQMAREGGGNYWVEFVGPLSIDELAAYRIPARALAFKARIFDSKNISTYTEAVSKLIAAGAPWEAIRSMFGDRPYTEGIGYAMPDDIDPNCHTCKGSGKTKNKWGDLIRCPCAEESKMSQVARAQKRAEADALKRRFDLPFTMAIGVNGDKDEVLAGEFTVEQGQDPAEIQARGRAASKTLRGDQGDIELTSLSTPGPTWEHPAADAQEVVWSVEAASEILTPKGARLGDCTPDQLIILTERGAGEMKDAAAFLLRQIENGQTEEIEA